MEKRQTSAPADEAPDELVQDAHIFGLDFHPSDDLLAVALITGDVKIYRYGTGGHSLVHHGQPHSAPCRAVMFSHDGRYLLSGSSDKSIRVTDVHTGQTVYTVPDAHGAAVNVVSRGGDGQQQQVFTGDDDGEVRVWDLRQPSQPVHSWHEHTDYVAALLPCASSNTLLSAGGDGRLGVWHTRKGRLEAMSDEQEDELLSLAVVKHGRKVLVGTQSGVLLYWTWGQWGDQSDRFPGHPMSVDQVVPIDDDTVVTASSDGLLRLCRLQPNRLLGVLGEHGQFPVELLRRSRDGRWLASASHDQVIKFWDLNYLLVSDGKEEVEEEEDQGAEAMDADAGSDEDSDADDDSESDSDEDMMRADRNASRGPKRRSRNFFGGLL